MQKRFSFTRLSNMEHILASNIVQVRQEHVQWSDECFLRTTLISELRIVGFDGA